MHNKDDQASEDQTYSQEDEVRDLRHRVKNDFNIISGIMLLQSEYSRVDQPFTHKVLNENMNRIKAIGLLYEQAYQIENSSLIQLDDYITAIVRSLYNTHHVQHINLEINTDEISIEPETAQAIGLIVNESLTNALTHAFPHENTGNIWLNLVYNQQEILLEITDNGKGLPSSFDYKNSGTTGFQLINSFASQIEATLDIQSNPGTQLKLVLPQKQR